MSNVNPKSGDIVLVDLKDGSYGFGRIRNNGISFYDLKKSEIPSIQEIIESKIIFTVWVMEYAFKKHRWKIIGNVPLEPDLEVPPKFFKQDPITKELSIYWEDSEPHEIPAKREECIVLERAAVWDPEHVEARLKDYFEGKENIWVKSLSLKD